MARIEMKNVLIIRSANMNVVNKLILLIKDKFKEQNICIYILIQKSLSKELKKVHKDIICIEKEDGNFSYSKFKKNKDIKKIINKIDFEEIYIPSSTVEFDDFEDTFLIASSIKAKSEYLFNCENEVYPIKLKKILIYVKLKLNSIVYILKIIISIILILFTYILYYPLYCIKYLYRVICKKD